MGFLGFTAYFWKFIPINYSLGHNQVSLALQNVEQKQKNPNKTPPLLQSVFNNVLSLQNVKQQAVL